MIENVDGRRLGSGVIGIQLAHLGAFGSGELKRGWSSSFHFLDAIEINIAVVVPYKVI